ncbi:MAG: LamG-like jellyroll fold domain-containing protein, partial [Polyangiaceae bacterium]
RATVRFFEGSRARILLLSRDGTQSAAIIAAGGAQIVGPDGTALARSASPLEPGRWDDVLLVLESGAGRLYVDGELAAEARGLAAGPGTWAIEAEGRRVDVRGLAVRGL